MSRLSAFTRHLLVAATLAALSGTAAADYRYWYQDDADFGHQAGDLTDGHAAIPAPAWACARRFFDGAQLQWIGPDAIPVGANNGGQDVYTSINVHFGTGVDCKPRPRMEKHPAATVIAPRAGSVYVEIDPDAGSYWIDKNGGWPACNCVAPVRFKALTVDVRWFALDRHFALRLSAAAGEEGSRRTLELDSLARALADLQASVAAEISSRRLTTLPTIETAVRQLEDGALASLSRAGKRLDECRAARDRGAIGDAYRACDRARRSVATAQRYLATVVDQMH